MTLFLAGVIVGVVACAGALYVFLQSEKRARAMCRALMALHAVEGVGANEPLLPTVPKNAPKLMTQQEFGEVAEALVGLGAKRAQAQQMVRSAFDVLTAQGAALTVEGMLRQAMETQGQRKERVQ